MRLLLDTHAFMWWDSASSRLSPQVSAACHDRSNVLLLSVASIWEIQIKSQLGKLHLVRPLSEITADQQQSNQLQVLPVALEHVIALHQLPMVHRDPFDRLLVAVARVENTTLASGDPIFRQYPVSLLW
jgi:PIN domain nuclease of toxin-antitoxin system